MEDIKVLFVLGVIIIVFGYWWKLTAYWTIKNSIELSKRLDEIEVNNEKFEHLKISEKWNIRFKNSGPLVWSYCKKIGILFICTGFISILIF